MSIFNDTATAPRYTNIPEEKTGDATYTPSILSNFVAGQIVKILDEIPVGRPLRILDPAIGDGELLVSLLRELAKHPGLDIEVYGFETDCKASNIATRRIRRNFPAVSVNFKTESFLEFVLENFSVDGNLLLFSPPVPGTYDLIIANPPYVRTQIMGAVKSKLLAEQFSLSGRVDLYYAFILGISQVLTPKGIAGIIVSNRFMTTKSGASVREALSKRFNIRHAWDLGDTKLFAAAVLPAVLLVEGKNGNNLETPAFTTIYQTREPENGVTTNPITALEGEGVIQTEDGRRFHVKHGKLDTSCTSAGVWRIKGLKSLCAYAAIWIETCKPSLWAISTRLSRRNSLIFPLSNALTRGCVMRKILAACA